MDLLKTARLVKLTKAGKPFTLMTLQAKKIKLTLALLLLGLKSLYACPLVGNVENSKKINKIQFCKPKNNFIAVNKIKM